MGENDIMSLPHETLAALEKTPTRFLGEELGRREAVDVINISTPAYRDKITITVDPPAVVYIVKD